MLHTKQIKIKEKVILVRGTEVNSSVEGSVQEAERLHGPDRIFLNSQHRLPTFVLQSGRRRVIKECLSHGPQTSSPSQSFKCSPTPTIHAAFGATPSGSSQATEAWALRNICGCLIDRRAGVDLLLHTGIWTFPHSPYPSELVQFQY